MHGTAEANTVTSDQAVTIEANTATSEQADTNEANTATSVQADIIEEIEVEETFEALIKIEEEPGSDPDYVPDNRTDDEALSPSEVTKPKSKPRKRPGRPKKKKGAGLKRTTGEQKKGKCRRCDEKIKHVLTLCSHFLRSSAAKRKAQVKRLKACQKCLSMQHTTLDCKAQTQCEAADCTQMEEHHTLLHPQLTRRSRKRGSKELRC